MTNHDLEHEFFTKVKGWWKCKLPLGGWAKNEISPGVWSDWTEHLPPISTDWQAFNEWVVPELVKGLMSDKKELIGLFFCEHKTPQRALEWAMDELQS